LGFLLIRFVQYTNKIERCFCQIIALVQLETLRVKQIFLTLSYLSEAVLKARVSQKVVTVERRSKCRITFKTNSKAWTTLPLTPGQGNECVICFFCYF